MKWLNMEEFEKLDNEDRAIVIAEHYGIMNYVVLKDELVFLDKIIYKNCTGIYEEKIDLHSLEDTRKIVGEDDIIDKALNIKYSDMNMIY